MVTDSDYLIVYGTLRPAFSNSYARHLRQHSQYVGEGSFPGLLFDLGTYPGAIYQEDSPQAVQGTIFDISHHKQTLLAYLDAYEGISDQFQQPHEYHRTIIQVNGPGKILNCWFYQYNWPTAQKKIIESGDYAGYIG
ncbi:gamma-glutamylcyclotransferase family protein [Spirosoma sp.]|uniref:gamma-glutamylcyclotransferase family protein n=1 Tax=Spirosoma sp. TaxID=1899569 RepID=UPI003B3BB0AF